MIGKASSVAVAIGSPRLCSFVFGGSAVVAAGGLSFRIALRREVLRFRTALRRGAPSFRIALPCGILGLRRLKKIEHAGDDICLGLLDMGDRFGGSVVDVDAAGAGDRAVAGSGNVLCDRAGNGIIHVPCAIQDGNSGARARTSERWAWDGQADAADMRRASPFDNDGAIIARRNDLSPNVTCRT